MTADGRRALLFLGGAAVLCAGLAGVLPGALRAAAGPESAIISKLMATESDGISLPVPGSPVPLVSKHHHFDRITVQVDPGGQSADAAATLDFTGAFGDTEVSSLGLEKIHFERRGGAWVATDGWAPWLSAIVGQLEARRRALESGEPGRALALEEPDSGLEPALAWVFTLQHRRYQVRAWYIRTERDESLISEEYRLQGELPDRPVDDEGQRRLLLHRIGREFFFSQGLM